MTARLRRTLAAGFATATALAALAPVLQGGHWFARVLGAVGIVALAGLVTRSLRVPKGLRPLVEPLSALVLLAGYLVVVFAPGTLRGGVPTAHTTDVLRTLLDQGRADLQLYAPPVVPHDGVVLLATAGVGLVAVAVDLLAVTFDRAALAGLPLLALFAVPSSVLPHGLGTVPFLVGAAGWLALLLEEGSERVSRWGSPLRSTAPGARPGGDDTGLGRVGRRVGAAALGLAIVVPAVVPGLDHRLVGPNGDGGLGAADGPNQATTYNPLTTLKDQLTLPTPRQLFVYATNDPSPDYLRMTTLDRYTGAGWASSKLAADREQARVQKGIPTPTGDDGSAAHDDATTNIAIDRLEVHWLPVPYGPRKVAVTGTWLWDAQSQTVFSASRTTRRLPPYTVTTSRVLPTRDALLASAGAAVDPEILRRYGGPVPVTATVAQLTRQVTRGAASPYDKAVAIQHYFTNGRNGFVYDVQASLPRAGQDPLEAFLAGKHGFCEQYATAMAVLLRVAGLPSRVAVGFTPGQQVAGHKGTYRVTTSDAHAWPEAWFAGTGWVRFEPTPAADGASIPDYTVTPHSSPSQQPTQRPAARPHATARPVAPHDPDLLLKQHRSHTSLPAAASGPAGPWVGGGLLVLLLASGPWMLTVLRRRSRLRHLDPERAWAQVHDDVTDVDGPWHGSDSPRAAARRVHTLLDPAGVAALVRLVDAVELARYAPPGRARTGTLAPDLQQVRRSLHSSAPRGVRWRAVVLAPSTVRWLTHLVAERVADMLDLSDRAVSTVLAPARRLRA